MQSQGNKRKWGKVPPEVQPIRHMVLRGQCITWLTNTRTKAKAKSGQRRQVMMEKEATVRSPGRKRVKRVEMVNKLKDGATVRGPGSANEDDTTMTLFSQVVRAQVHETCGPGFEPGATPAMAGNDVFGLRALDSRIAGGQIGGVMLADETINASVHCDDAELWRGLRRHEEMVPRLQAARHRDQLSSALLGDSDSRWSSGRMRY